MKHLSAWIHLHSASVLLQAQPPFCSAVRKTMSTLCSPMVIPATTLACSRHLQLSCRMLTQMSMLLLALGGSCMLRLFACTKVLFNVQLKCCLSRSAPGPSLHNVLLLGVLPTVIRWMIAIVCSSLTSLQWNVN